MYQSMLENAGIQTFVRNESLQQALGGLAMAFFAILIYLPALCVVNDDDYPDAMAILLALKNESASGGGEWKCAQCGESSPANFTSCWRCQAPR
jgi:hypothetical protein